MTSAKADPGTRRRRSKSQAPSLMTAGQLAELLAERISGVIRTDHGWVILEAAVDGESVRLEATRMDIEASSADEVMRRDLKLSVPRAAAVPAEATLQQDAESKVAESKVAENKVAEKTVEDAGALPEPTAKLKRAG